MNKDVNLWVEANIGNHKLHLLKQDASLRRYYRVDSAPTTIVMDASSESNSERFFQAAKLLRCHHVLVPEILKQDISRGYFQLEDLGDQHLLAVTDSKQLNRYLLKAVDMILKMQNIAITELSQPIDFSKNLARDELTLFARWFIKKYAEYQLSAADEALLENTFEFILKAITAQPQVVMHRDYHSKNLMAHENTLRVIDFQDLMIGPVTYDLVSLLKDAYASWPDPMEHELKQHFFSRMDWHIHVSEFEFLYDMTGLQRHLKILGGFSKIYFERGNGVFLQHFDRVLNHVVETTAKYSELEAFHLFFTTKLLPKVFEI